MPKVMQVQSERVRDASDEWFLLEGLAFAALAWIALAPSRARRWWTGTAAVATVGLTVVGLLSAFGLIGEFIIV